MCGVMGKIVQDRSALSVLVRGNAHWRGLAAALVDDAVLAAQETKQLWREDGLLMLVKYVIHNNDDNNEDDDPSHFLCVCLSLSLRACSWRGRWPVLVVGTMVPFGIFGSSWASSTISIHT
jgi:hypothetical protein